MSPLLQSLYVGADLMLPPGISLNGQVTGCFSRAVHVELEDGRLLTLLHDRAQYGMRTTNLDDEAWAVIRPALHPGSCLKLSPHVIEHDDFRLDWGNSPVWQSPEVHNCLSHVPAEQLHNRLAQGQSWLEDSGAGKPLNNPFWDAAHTCFMAVVAALPAADAVQEEAVRITIGLGPGLTPSGDDMLSGLLIGLHASGDLVRATRLAEQIRSHFHETSQASRDGLEQACRGWMTARLADVITALAGKPDAPLLEAALAAQSIVGYYSGRDSLFGLFAGLEATLSLQSPYPSPHSALLRKDIRTPQGKMQP